MARTPPSVPGSIIHVVQASGNVYTFPQPVDTANLVIGTLSLLRYITRGAGRVDPIDFKPGAVSTTGCSLENWTVDWTVSEPLWTPLSDWSVSYTKRALVVVTKAATGDDPIPYTGTFDHVTTTSFTVSGITYVKDTDFSVVGTAIHWLGASQPATGSTYTLEIVEVHSQTLPKETTVLDLGTNSLQVTDVRLADGSHVYTVGDDVTVYAKELVPPAGVVLDAQGRYIVNTSCKRVLKAPEDYSLISGGFQIGDPLVTDTEARFDYNYPVRPGVT